MIYLSLVKSLNVKKLIIVLAEYTTLFSGGSKTKGSIISLTNL